MRLGFLLLIGLPSSGKTTLAKALSKDSESDSSNTFHFIHICYDDLIRFPNGNYESEWKSARRALSVKIEDLVIALKNKNFDLCPTEFRSQFEEVPWESDVVLILDDNMYFKSMRYSLFQIAKKHNISFCQIYLICSLEKALLKNSFRGPNSIVPPHIIENMHSKIEPPNPKNNWEKYSLELDAFCDVNVFIVRCKIFSIVNESLSDTMYTSDDSEMRELSKIQCKKSVLHQTDIALRRIINFKIKSHCQENSCDNSKEYITELNCRKSEILSDIKSGIICLPKEVINEIDAATVEKFQLRNFLNSYF